MSTEIASLSAQNEPETQSTICEWAKAAFGSGGSDIRVVARANEEMAELLRATTAQALPQDVMEEAADVLIVLARVGDRQGIKLNLSNSLPLTKALSLDEIAARANGAIALMIQDLASTEVFTRSALETAWFALLSLIKTVGGDPQAVIDAKMRKNRKRVWKQDGSGVGYHTRNKQLADT